ncbi:MAG: HEPN domain-containing protein [Planctomycetaceae bacterium]|jgi:HEPN domain-containing protein|nr:HEPN domain-containing protein [Planctomycetaceae bacterium]
MTVTDLIEQWFQKAKSDLNAAKTLAKLKPPEKDIVCFHCQQAAEKALKAYLIFHDVEPERTHDLEKLCKDCGQYDDSFFKFLGIGKIMSKYAVQPRYPSYFLNITETETEQAIEYAQSIYDFCWVKIFPDSSVQ